MKKLFLLSLLTLGLVGTQQVMAASVPPLICQQTEVPHFQNIDVKKVQDAWLSWYNEARKKNGLEPYVYDVNLGRTAIVWSEAAVQKGTITHKRPGQKKYYDYAKMVAWFKDLGLTFKKVGKAGFVENIGWDYYSCSDKEADCTSQLISSIRHTYDFFIGEKGKKNHVHYDSIMSKNYKKIGLGIAVDPVKKKYYLTVHYAAVVNVENSAMDCNTFVASHKF